MFISSYSLMQQRRPFRLPMPYNTTQLSDPPSIGLQLIPRHLPTDLAYTLQRTIPQFHRTKLNHPRVESQCCSYISLCPARSIVSHDEIMAIPPLLLMFARLFRKTEYTPVLDNSYRTSRIEDECPSCTGDSVSVSDRKGEKGEKAHSLTSRRFPGRTYK